MDILTNETSINIMQAYHKDFTFSNKNDVLGVPGQYKICKKLHSLNQI